MKDKLKIGTVEFESESKPCLGCIQTNCESCLDLDIKLEELETEFWMDEVFELR